MTPWNQPNEVGPIQHLRVGSISERVAQPAPCPVRVALGEILRRAIVAIAGTAATAQALAALARLLPAETERPVIPVHVSFFRGLGKRWAEDRQLVLH